MPDLGGLQPAANGPAGAAGQKNPPGAAGPAGAADPTGFKARLAAKLAARKTHQSVPQEHLADLIRLCNERGEAFESAKLVTKYPITEKDDALYEVRTDRSTHRIIRGRDGSYTIF
jgi:hypothetical protein